MAFAAAKAQTTFVVPTYPGPNDFVFPDTQQLVIDTLANASSHAAENLRVWSGHDLANDVRFLTIHCAGCQKDWRWLVHHTMIYDTTAMETSLSNFFAGIRNEPCYLFVLLAELAEFVTTRVAEAGARGVKLSALLAEAREDHLCSRNDFEEVLRRMGFEIEYEGPRPEELTMDYAYLGGVIIDDPWVLLPAGHPLKEED